MPINEQHKKKRGRNIALLLVLLGVIATLYVLAMVRMAPAVS
tara:strand:- start:335 stop:460 length:126 start_codon:yes stop_codon:yes gene_type:complete